VQPDNPQAQIPTRSVGIENFMFNARQYRAEAIEFADRGPSEFFVSVSDIGALLKVEALRAEIARRRHVRTHDRRGKASSRASGALAP
jgi:hypothetical protein